jgi:hypothetical protein
MKEHLEKIAAEHGDISFSEILRIYAAFAIVSGFKPPVGKDETETKKNISNLLFESRKATENPQPGVPGVAGAPKGFGR